jgi:hypothetical protein
MNVLVIPDLHCPWQHPCAVDFLADLRRKYKPGRVVCLGDEIDFHNLSRYVKNPNLGRAAEEVERARGVLRQLYRLFPRVIVCESNHGLRLCKRAEEVGIPSHFLRPLSELLEAPPGWIWQERFLLENILFLHGDGFSGPRAAITAAMRYRCNIVMGHVHAHAGVQYLTGAFDRIWGLQTGCLIDPAAPAFGYAKDLADRPTLGAGILCDRVPHFVPFTP